MYMLHACLHLRRACQGGLSCLPTDLSAQKHVQKGYGWKVDSCLLACSLHYRMYLRGLSDYALIQNVTFFATDGPDQSGIPPPYPD